MEDVSYEDILKAQQTIGDTLLPTALLHAFDLDAELNASLWLKGELFQPTGSFKTRGALNWVRTATPAELQRGLITVSAGNHALALAWAARQVDTPVTVVMPVDCSPTKLEATRRYGAEVILHGEITQAVEKMHEIRERSGLVLVHPYDDPRVIAGQGTVGLEILEMFPEVDLIVCPIGGGGLISGIGIAVKQQSSRVRLVGVEPAGAAAMHYAWQQGGPVRLSEVRTLAASLAPAIVSERTYALSRRYVDEIVLLSEGEIVSGLRSTLLKGRICAEPGGAAAIAALLCDRVRLYGARNVVAVVTGGNIDLPVLRELA